MSNDNVVELTTRGGRGGGGSDGGDLARRVERLEDSSRRVEAALARVEERLASVDDGQRKLREEFVELKGRIAAVDGRLQGIEGRFAFIPTSVQLLGFAVAVFLAAGVLQYLGPRLAPPPQPIVIQAPPPR